MDYKHSANWLIGARTVIRAEGGSSGINCMFFDRLHTTGLFR